MDSGLSPVATTWAASPDRGWGSTLARKLASGLESWAAYLAIALAAVNLAYWAYVYEPQPIIWDAGGYYALGLRILEKGLLDYVVPDDAHWSSLAIVRPYVYPAFLAGMTSIADGKPVVMQFLAFNVQLFLYLAICLYGAVVASSIFRTRWIGVVTFLVSALHPVLVVQTATVLTDLPSAMFGYLSVLFAIHAFFGRRQRLENVLIALALFSGGISALIRPSNVLILVMVLVLWIARMLWTRSWSVRALPFIGLVAVAPFVPQVVMHYRATGSIQVFGGAGVYIGQVNMGVHVLKYATVLGGGKGGPLVLYANPFRPDEVTTAEAFLRKAPGGYVATLGAHLMALFDQRLPLPYAHRPHPWYEWPVLLLSWLFLFLAGAGVVTAVRRWREGKERGDSLVAVGALVGIAGVTVAPYVAPLVETRYALPAYLLLAPVCAYGAGVWWDLHAQRGRKGLVGWYLGLALVLVGAVWFASWLDGHALLCTGWRLTIETATGCVAMVSR